MEKSLSKEASFSLEESANLANVERLTREETEKNILLGTTESPAATTTTTMTSSTQVSTTGATEQKIDQDVIDEVKDDDLGDEFAHQISNDGVVNTREEYRIALPDGRVQVCMS